MNFKALLGIILVLEHALLASSHCYKMSGCRGYKRNGGYQEKERFPWVNETTGSCSICTCTKKRHYVATCMQVRVVDMPLPVRKASLLSKITDTSNERMTATFGEDEEHQINEEEAFNMECEPEAIPKFNDRRQMLEFKFVNYYSWTWETNCCQRTPSFGDNHPYCKVKFTKKCKPRGVLRDKPSRRCPLPLPRILRG